MQTARRAAAIAGFLLFGVTDGDRPNARAASAPAERGVAMTEEASELLAIIYRYYPRWDPAEESLESFFNTKVDVSPQDRARRAVAQAGYDDVRDWRVTVAAIAEALPPHHVILDASSWAYPSYEATLGPREPMPENGIHKSLMVAVSMLAPYYVIYEQHILRVDGLNEEFTQVFELSDEFAHLVPIVERAIAERYGYRRLDPALAQMAVPGTVIYGIEADRDTLARALFGPKHL